MRSVIQPKLRWFKTSGTRASGCLRWRQLFAFDDLR